MLKKLRSQGSKLGSPVALSGLVRSTPNKAGPQLGVQGQRWAAAHFLNHLYSGLLWNQLVTPRLSHSAPEWDVSQGFGRNNAPFMVRWRLSGGPSPEPGSWALQPAEPPAHGPRGQRCKPGSVP